MSMISRLLIIACLFVSSAQADVIVSSIGAGGSGLNKEEAVLMALENAVGKAFGFSLEGALVRSLKDNATYGTEGNSEEIVSRLSRSVVRQTRTPDNAPVTGYEVLDVYETQTGWEAHVRLYYKAYKKLGDPDKRRTLVVSATDTRAATLAEAIEASLMASRRFDVLKRDDAGAFAAEKAFIRGSDAEQGELARLGRGKGADYLVLVKTSKYFSHLNDVKHIQATGERLYHSEAGFNYDIEVVEFSSREMKWRKRGKVSASTDKPISDASSLLAGRITRLADSIGSDLIGAIYPPRIVRVMGDRAVLNRGEGAVKLGQQVTIYALKEALIDPQSGESLGGMEQRIASAVVVELKPKFSVLELSAGSLQHSEDYIVRWSQSSAQAPSRRHGVHSERIKQKEALEKARSLDDAFLR
ncbi:periplasmic protein [Magnetococcus marinus MC-1]|uniref:Periplasmic protein n=1 Tax=Magnetococcus marinus (strain ATCC BAA-1437 / JCM 17883 / MC-1) TaxID=156889 RepID=A0LBE0_MAGMM|nr:hypothetical protein [Magnetococcus marinus]ABK45283.1 periplasmic protein [Magnetococcus marinus MC-1]